MTFWVISQTYSALDNPWNFRGATMAALCSRAGLVGPVPKGRWRFSWTNRRYGRILSSLTWTKHETPIKWMEASLFSCSKKQRPTQYSVRMMFSEAYDSDGVILHHTAPPRQTVNTVYFCSFLQTTFVQRSGKNDDTWWYGISSFFMTMQGVTPLLLSRISCAIGNGGFWSIIRTPQIRFHAITIFSPKWKDHGEGPGTTQEMNLTVL